MHRSVDFLIKTITTQKKNKEGTEGGAARGPFILAGLGNPGASYAATRHNAGFMVIDHLAKHHEIQVKKLKHKALIGEGLIGDRRVILVKPQTFMNLSGQSLRQVLAYYKAAPQRLIVLYDDLDIDLGRIRVRPSGGSGTHNGMRSIVQELGSEAFARIRVGIGKTGGEDVADFVLGRFSGAESALIEKAVEQAALAAAAIVSEGIEKAMNEYNKK